MWTKFHVFDFQSEFFNEALPYRIDFDTRNERITKIGLDDIKPPEDLKPFLFFEGQGQ